MTIGLPDFPWTLGRFFLHPCTAAHERRNPCGEGVSPHNSQPKRRWHKSIHVKFMPHKILLSLLGCSQDWRSRWLVVRAYPTTASRDPPFTWTKALSHPQLCFIHVLLPQEGEGLCSFILWNFQLQPIKTQTDLFLFFFFTECLKTFFSTFPK